MDPLQAALLGCTWIMTIIILFQQVGIRISQKRIERMLEDAEIHDAQRWTLFYERKERA